MKGISNEGVVDWLQFRAPDKNGIDTEFTVHLTFLMSGWECIYGRGCPGHFGVVDRYITPDFGCCTDGFYVAEGEKDSIDARMAELTDEDWDTDLRAYVEKNGWSTMKGKSEKSRIYNGACVFANRQGGSAGKVGCAFVAMANRRGENVDDATVDGHDSHTHYMPTVCHELPLKFDWEELEDEEKGVEGAYASCTIGPWDAGRWTEDDLGRDQRDWMAWWCVDVPETYRNEVALYVRMKDTLVNGIGQVAYDMLCDLIDRKKPNVDPMKAATLNGGRPLLPLLIGGREMKRDFPPFTEALERMKEESQ